jgi:predicted protein tyrosine phosphatase
MADSHADGNDGCRAIVLVPGGGEAAPRVDRVCRGVLIGNCHAAAALDVLERCHVTHTLSVVVEVDKPPSPDRPHIRVAVEDSRQPPWPEKLAEALPEAVRFIDSAVAEGGTVLVHCNQGTSRSVTVVLAYLIKHKAMTLREAFNTMTRRRSPDSPATHPNIGFLRGCLVPWEMAERGVDAPSINPTRYASQSGHGAEYCGEGTWAGDGMWQRDNEFEEMADVKPSELGNRTAIFRSACIS